MSVQTTKKRKKESEYNHSSNIYQPLFAGDTEDQEPLDEPAEELKHELQIPPVHEDILVLLYCTLNFSIKIILHLTLGA